MPTILSFLSGRQITNASGVPQSGAKLYHYRAGTTTNLTVWQNADGTGAHAQPVECDAGGFVPLIYVDDTFDWKVLITTAADVTLQTYDELPAAEADASAVGFAPPLLEWTQVTSSASPVALTAGDAGKAYEADTTGGSIEFDLPDAASVGNGRGFVFKKTAAANTLTLDPSGSQTIDDSTSAVIINKDIAYGIFSNGAEWYRTLGMFGSLINVQAFTGTDTYTPTSGMNSCLVISTGGGGGGGGVDGLDADCGAGAGGGGGGATCIEFFPASTVGASQAVTIGAGGTAGTDSGGDGGNGGDTTFGALHTAGGGVGGTGRQTANSGEVTNGGAGGTATGGLVNIAGGRGGPGIQIEISQEAAFGGPGGGSFWGGGAPQVIKSAAGTVAGATGAVYGGGGGGAAMINGTTGAAGGAGIGGICVVLEFA